MDGNAGSFLEHISGTSNLSNVMEMPVGADVSMEIPFLRFPNLFCGSHSPRSGMTAFLDPLPA